MKKTYILFLSLVLTLAACKSSKHADLGDGVFAGIHTNKGDIILKLEHNKTPLTVANFVSLAEGNSPFVSDEFKGKKYYDGLIFHRVMKDFMIQGGDPLANGTGGPGYKFKDEFHDSLAHSKKGILSMANPGPNSNGSQFFITHKETPWLNNKHSVFGEVVEGIGVLDTIANVVVAQGSNKPTSDVVMNTVEIIRNGKEAKKFDAVQIMTDYFAEEELASKAMEKIKSDFLAKVAQQKEAAETLPSGLKIYKVTEGTGEKPQIGQKVLVNYAGWLEDGTLFDTSDEIVAEKFGMLEKIKQMHRGNLSPSPMDYSPEAQLAAGFREGLLTMKVGDKIRVFIPPYLGYGERDYGPIPGNSDLVFDIEIVE
ncbi:cyclophilin family peptidyl-prolyl cis-trans isomerase [Saonia flava]|uniref:peptidylprolyl isomerase n=1 Tax=Saonia flava TaxID=523696 RepID=A0A846QVG8_9FLAO|nr:peptidylprolyl isomerase [Saonia flava]NJB72281.1 cyclophilin family peptidyl-prolyl cis-trans isomerase [Saonia flava]